MDRVILYALGVCCLMRKSILICILLLFVPFFILADSFSLSTSISSVQPRSDFGMGMFPVGTSFGYSDSFKLFPSLPSARFNISTEFRFDNASTGGYSWKTGTPAWSLRKNLQNTNDGNDYYSLSNSYLRTSSYIDAYIQQGFGKNPVSGGKPLVNVRLGFRTRFAYATESLSALSSTNDRFAFVDKDGKPLKYYEINANGDKEYFDLFGPNTIIPAYPWLQDNRKSWNNYLYLSTYWYFNKGAAFGVSDGLYGYLTFEYGPWWLANTISPKGVSSDYWSITAYLEETMSLFSVKQDNGRNWMNIFVGHSNTFQYTGGDVVPEHKIPTDRLRGKLSDSIWIRFNGPQFIASDCYTYFNISLNNNLYFGHVVNEASNKTKAVELQSSINGTFHLRLFGFIRFEYTLGYTMMRGIHASYPAWSQRADLKFTVSI